MAEGRQDATNESQETTNESQEMCTGEEVWAVEVVESVGTKENIETFTLAVKDLGLATVTGKRISIRLVNVATMIPCGLGSSLPVSQVDKAAIKAHELRLFKLLITPLLTCPASKNVVPKYVPVRNDKRAEGIIQAANKLMVSRFYIPVKKNSNMVERLALEMPGGCLVIGVLGGKKMAECEAQRVDMFDSQDTAITLGLDNGDTLEYLVNSSGESRTLKMSSATSSGFSSPPRSRRDGMVEGDNTPKLSRKNSRFDGSNSHNFREYSSTVSSTFGQSSSTRGAPLRQMSYTSSVAGGGSVSAEFLLRRGVSDANVVVLQSSRSNHIPMVMEMLSTSAPTPTGQLNGFASCLPGAMEMPVQRSSFSSPSSCSTDSSSLGKGGSNSHDQRKETGMGQRSPSAKTTDHRIGQFSPNFGASVAQKLQSFSSRMIAEKRSGSSRLLLREHRGKERSLSRMGSVKEEDPSTGQSTGKSVSTSAIPLRK